MFLGPRYGWDKHQPHATGVEDFRVRLLLLGAAPAVAAGSRSWPSTSGASVAMEEDSPVFLSTRPLRELGDAEEPAESPDADLQGIGRLLEAAAARQGGTLDSSEKFSRNSEFSRKGQAYVAYKLRSVDSSLGTVSSQCPAGGAGPDCK